MKKIKYIIQIAILILIGFIFAIFPESVSAQTPTPNEDGQIIYTVQEGDTCTRIFILTGVTIDKIIALNDLGDDCEIFPSQQLILGTAEQATATPEGPISPPTPGPPTPTPFEGFGQVCVVLYEDLDGNQMRSRNEFYLGGGVISMNNRAGTFSEIRETAGGDPALVDPVCFENVPEGEYNLSMGIPDGFNPTTSMNYALSVSAGDTIVIDFGAQPSAQMNNGGGAIDGGGRSPLLLAIGLFLIAGGAGLAFFFIRSRMDA